MLNLFVRHCEREAKWLTWVLKETVTIDQSIPGAGIAEWGIENNAYRLHNSVSLQVPRGFRVTFQSLSAFLTILEPGTGKISRPQAHKKKTPLVGSCKFLYNFGHNFTSVYLRRFMTKESCFIAEFGQGNSKGPFYVLLVFGIFWWNFSYSIVVWSLRLSDIVVFCGSLCSEVDAN